MEILSSMLKYTFVVALAVEALIIARAVVRLAREKARPAGPGEAGK
jgi:hypothetical protein